MLATCLLVAGISIVESAGMDWGRRATPGAVRSPRDVSEPGDFARPSESRWGAFHFDAGIRTIPWKSHGMAWGGELGLYRGFGDAEFGLRIDASRFPARQLSDRADAPIEARGASAVAYYSPYHRGFRPLIGAHLGRVRLDDMDSRWEVGLDALGVLDVDRRIQVYASVSPGYLVGDRASDLWIRLGLGLRLRVGG